MRRLLVVRHGESEWNRLRRWQGWEDPPLTVEGRAQARQRARALGRAARIDAVACSDLQRARVTAELMALALGLEPPHVDARLRERHGGEWQGLTGDEIEQRWPGLRDRWRRGEVASPPGGETTDEILDRVDGALADVDTRVGAGRTVLVVTHHGVLRLLSSRAGVPLTELIPNLGGRWFDYDRGDLVARGALPALAAGERDAGIE